MFGVWPKKAIVFIKCQVDFGFIGRYKFDFLLFSVEGNFGDCANYERKLAAASLLISVGENIRINGP